MAHLMDQLLKAVSSAYPLPTTHSNMVKKARVYTSDEWEKQRDNFTKLYLNQDKNLTLATAKESMEKKHGFYATEAQYKRKIKAWGLERNLDTETALGILLIEDKRKREGGKSTMFRYKGREMSRDRMGFLRKRRKELVRKTYSNPRPDGLDEGSNIAVVTPLHVEYSTPSPRDGSLEDAKLSMVDSPGSDGVVAYDSPPHPEPPSRRGSNTDGTSLDGLSFLTEGIQKASLESQSPIQKRLESQCQSSFKSVSGVEISNDLNDSSTPIGAQRIQQPDSEYSSKLLSTGDNDAAFSLTGALWMSAGAKSIIGSWIRDDVVMSGMSPFNFKSPSFHSSSHFSKSKGIFSATCCGVSFQKPYDMLSHYGKHHSHQNQERFDDTVLIEAARNGNEEGVRLVLKRGVDLSVVNSNDGRTALHWAAFEGFEAIASLLVENGIDPSVKDKAGDTALHDAACKGYEKIVRLLLERSIDISAQNKYGWTALHWAAYRSHDVVVRVLLENGIDFSLKDQYGRTALHWAGHQGYEAVVRLLLEKDIDLLVRDTEYGFTVLHLAASLGHEAVVHLLIEKDFDISVQDHEYGRTALHWAVLEGYETIAFLLLKKGIDPSVKDKVGDTALHLAAFRGHETIVRLLLEKSIDLSVRGEDGYTALHLAASLGHESVVHLLREKNIDLSVRDECGRTALHLAAHGGYEKIVHLLLKKNIDISARDKGGCTALHLAVYGGYETIVRLLLKKGINPQDGTKMGVPHYT